MVVNITDFQNDLKQMSIDEACKKHHVKLQDIMREMLLHSRRKVAKENITHKTTTMHKNKYLEFKSGRVYLKAPFANCKRMIATFRDVEDARIVRDEMIKCNWNRDNLESILLKHHISILPYGTVLNRDAYIEKTKRNTFCIRKAHKSNGEWRCKSYGTYKSLEDAYKIRDALIDCNWDISQLNGIKKTLGIKDSKGR